MTTLVLVRHGHTDAAGKRLTGWEPGIHLTERGREQARRLVGRLEGVRIDAIYSSPLERCRETAAALAKGRGLPVRVRRAWIETGYGDWTGRTISQLRRTKLWRRVMHAPSNVRFPGGESLLEVQGRAVVEALRIAEDHPGGIVAVISHADPIRLLLAHVAGVHPDLFHRLSVDTASISIVAIEGGAPRLITVNDTGDLSALLERRDVRTKVRG